MRAFIIALVIVLGGCAGNPLIEQPSCNPIHPSFDSVEVHNNGSITLTEAQLEDLLLYIDDLERCAGV